jgi:hypothetical protein
MTLLLRVVNAISYLIRHAWESTKAAHISLGNIGHRRCKCAVKLGWHAEDHYKYRLRALQGNYSLQGLVVFSEVSGLLP